MLQRLPKHHYLLKHGNRIMTIKKYIVKIGYRTDNGLGIATSTKQEYVYVQAISVDWARLHAIDEAYRIHGDGISHVTILGVVENTEE